MRAVIITGASSGIGLRLAQRLALRGYHVYAGARHADDLKRLSATHTNITAVALDVTCPEQVEQLVERVRAEPLAALINNAGIALIGPIESITADEFEQQLQVNLIGSYRMIRACVPLLRHSGGRIVNISSTSGLVAWPFAGAYVASKYGLEGLSDVLRLELGRFGIRTIVINPGAVDTPLWEKTFSTLHQRLADQSDEVRTLYSNDVARSEQAIRKTIRAAVAPDVVVEKVVEALEHEAPRTRYLIGPSARLQQWLKNLLPVRWYDWLKRRIVYGGE